VGMGYFQMNFKEILIFVAGTTPQIITETIYALSQKAPSIYPDEIFIITTSTGRKRIEDTLLKQGVLKRLVREYSFPDINLTEDSFIIVLTMGSTSGERNIINY